MENSHLSGQKIAFASQDESNLQASVSDFDEEEDINNNEDYFQTEEVDVLEANNENQKKSELFVGMDFSSDESAYKAYRKYGGDHGFNIRRQRTVKRNNKLVRMVYVCSKEGFRQEPKVNKPHSLRTIRCGCKARMSCYLQINGRYKIVTFEPNHNHDLVRTPMKHLLKSNRAMSISQKQHANDADMSGISAKATVEMMSREVGGQANLGFMDKDLRNYIYRKRMAEMKKGDAGAVLEYFQKKKEDTASFFYSIQLDEDDMITNIFWADDRSIGDYNLFGDVVCFDTTYKTNEYDRPFAPFVGVNHHKQTIVFGAALLYDETIESFEWLFQTFLGVMSGKQPQTILTDQCAAIANAIGKVFPETKYRLCVWHIYQNAAKRLSRVFHGPNQFATDFRKCVDGHEKSRWTTAFKLIDVFF
ncbi:protein FAR1-RELATED SEQUENCE 5-like [Raphanus sativus]|uniref:Protein FAR1-RELATED SEQUENCE 5-like n=1 Tax=Raphanus sativus TaxID=3726 RepID=A0A6J0NW55_RAPSA|nr:protein FAR1-RELATED SEQUENCE 5-like [Raphanus sativus]